MRLTAARTTLFAVLLASCNQLTGNERKTFAEPAAGASGGPPGGAAASGGSQAGQAGAGGARASGGSLQAGAAGTDGVSGQAGAGAGGAPPETVPCDEQASPESGGDGLVRWLRGDTLDGAPGDAIASWPDARCDEGAAQGEKERRPRTVIDQRSGRRMARLDGVDDFLEIGPSTPSFSKGFTAIMVVRPLRTGRGSTPLLHLGNDGIDNGLDWFFPDANQVALVAYTPSVVILARPGALEPSTLQVATLVIEPNRTRFFKDGALLGDESNAKALSAAVRVHNVLGQDLTQNLHAAMDLGEFLLYKRALSDDERSAIEGALLSRWKVCPDEATLGDDALNCGLCGRACAAGERCTAGQCEQDEAGVTCPSRLYAGDQILDVCGGVADWVRARQHCASLRSELWAPADQADADRVRSRLSVSGYVNVSDQSTEGTFSSADGVPLSYQPWAAGEPSGGEAAQCAMLDAGGTLSNITCGAQASGQWACARGSAITCYPRYAGGRRYDMCSLPVDSYAHRRDFCESRGAKLAHIDDEAENEVLRGFVAPPPAFAPLVIDVNDVAIEGYFVDGNNQPPTFTKWKAGSPAGAGNAPDADCVALTTEGDWALVDCSNDERMTLCEYEQDMAPSCEGLALPPYQPLSNDVLDVTDVSVDGAGDTGLVKAGQTFSLSFTFSLNVCSLCPNCVTLLEVNFVPGPPNGTCPYSAVPGCAVVSKKVTKQLTAPTAIGVFDVMASISQGFSCNGYPSLYYRPIARICTN